MPTETHEIEARALFMAVADAEGGTGTGMSQAEEQVEKTAEAGMPSMTTGLHSTSLWPASSCAWGSALDVDLVRGDGVVMVQGGQLNRRRSWRGSDGGGGWLFEGLSEPIKLRLQLLAHRANLT